MSANAFSIAAIASGLFASMAILTAGPPRTLRMISTPTRMRSARSSITRKSAVRYGSHSAPFSTRYSQRLVGGGLSLTAVGKPAPPMPQMPACSTRFSNSSLEAVFQSSGARTGETPGTAPSGASAVVSRITASALAPVGPGRFSTALTRPSAGARTRTEMKPFFSPMSWPRRTKSPAFTTHFAGAPRCWLIETTSSAGTGIRSIALPRASSLL